MKFFFALFTLLILVTIYSLFLTSSNRHCSRYQSITVTKIDNDLFPSKWKTVTWTREDGIITTERVKWPERSNLFRDAVHVGTTKKVCTCWK